MTTKPAGSHELGLPHLILALVVVAALAHSLGYVRVSPATSAPATTPPTVASTQANESLSLLAAASTAQVATLPATTPIPLPPSHEGGAAATSALPLTGIKARLALASRGFPDAGVNATAPPNAVKVAAIFSYYWPNLLGTNCSDPRNEIPSWASNFPNADTTNGWCWSTFSNGERWEYWMNRAVACPQSWPFKTKVYAFGKEWICKDHGGAIVDTGEGVWIDFMTPNPPIAFRSHFDVWVVYP